MTNVPLSHEFPDVVTDTLYFLSRANIKASRRRVRLVITACKSRKEDERYAILDLVLSSSRPDRVEFNEASDRKFVAAHAFPA